MLNNLSIVVIHYHVPNLLRECLVRLKSYYPNAEIIVVDTDLQPETETFLTTYFPEIKLIATENYSMAHAANAGLKAASKDFIAHMNADVLIGENSFRELLRELENEQVGIVGPVCLTSLGVPQDQGLPYKRFHWQLHHAKENSIAVTWLSGCLQVIRRDALKNIGYLDRELRFYNEDMEWCWRARQKGYQVKLVNTPVLHYGGSSTPKNPLLLVEGYRGGFVLSQAYRSKNFQKLHYWLVRFEAVLKQYLAPKAYTRKAYKGIYWLFKNRKFSESPLGETLNTTNPNWPKFEHPIFK